MDVVVEGMGRWMLHIDATTAVGTNTREEGSCVTINFDAADCPHRFAGILDAH